VVFSVLVINAAFSLALVLGILRFHFWLPEIFWVGLLFISTPQGNFAPRLRYLPPYFDELVLLPLPFMATMIVKAYQENSDAARETINYLTYLTNQKEVAAKATVAILKLLPRMWKISLTKP
jgi:AAA+ ATPase superfamily predicted ATPase